MPHIGASGKGHIRYGYVHASPSVFLSYQKATSLLIALRRFQKPYGVNDPGILNQVSWIIISRFPLLILSLTRQTLYLSLSIFTYFGNRIYPYLHLRSEFPGNSSFWLLSNIPSLLINNSELGTLNWIVELSNVRMSLSLIAECFVCDHGCLFTNQKPGQPCNFWRRRLRREIVRFQPSY